MISIQQCRAARGLLDWTQQDLADACGLSKTAINNFEKGHSDIKAESLRAIRLAFESVDIEFMDENGLRKKDEMTRLLRGKTAWNDLIHDINQTLQSSGELLVFSLGENPVILKGLKETPIRLITQEGISNGILTSAETRYLPKETIPLSFNTLIYGHKIAFELRNRDAIVIVESRDASETERKHFENTWQNSRIKTSGKNSASI